MGTVPGVPPAKPEVEEVLETKLSNMFSSSLALSLLFFGLASAFELEDSLLEYDESESDPRLFFSNFTSGLVAINTTLLTYGVLIVLGGAAIALHVPLGQLWREPEVRERLQPVWGLPGRLLQSLCQPPDV